MNASLIAEIKRRGIPEPYSQENAEDPMVYLELRLFQSSWRWFVTEAQIEGDDVLFFGFVVGFEKEWGYFRLSELRSGDRSLYVILIKPMPFSELKKERDL